MRCFLFFFFFFRKKKIFYLFPLTQSKTDVWFVHSYIARCKRPPSIIYTAAAKWCMTKHARTCPARWLGDTCCGTGKITCCCPRLIIILCARGWIYFHRKGRQQVVARPLWHSTYIIIFITVINVTCTLRRFSIWRNICIQVMVMWWVTRYNYSISYM